MRKTLSIVQHYFAIWRELGKYIGFTGGFYWLRYDEQFRQRKKVQPSLCWDHKDISLCMQLMAVPTGRGQSFPGAAGGSSTGGSSAGPCKGC